MKLTVDKLSEILPDFRLDRRGKNLIGPCPMCGHNEFGISLEEGHRFGCYRKKNCGWTGNIVTLLRHLGKYDLILFERSNVLSGRIELEEFDVSGLELNAPTISYPIGWRRLFEDEYLASRGLQSGDYDRYEVGRTKLDIKMKNDYVIFGVKEHGELKGWVGRHTWSKERIEAYNNDYKKKYGISNKIKRYLNSLSDFAKLIYGFDEVIEGATKIVICVEGIFDKINVDRLLNLHTQDIVKCNATFKCDVSDEQIVKWKQKGIESLILLYDPDVIRQTKTSIERLERFFNVKVGYSASGCDPGDMSETDIDNALDRLEDPIQFKINKLEVSKL